MKTYSRLPPLLLAHLLRIRHGVLPVLFIVVFFVRVDDLGAFRSFVLESLQSAAEMR